MKFFCSLNPILHNQYRPLVRYDKMANLARLLVGLILSVCFLFLYTQIVFFCLEFLLIHNKNLLFSRLKLLGPLLQNGFRISSSYYNNYYSLIIITMAICMDCLILYWYSKNFAIFLHRIYYKIQHRFLFNVRTDIKGISRIKEKYLNFYIEDVVFAVFRNRLWLEDLVITSLSIYLVIMFFHSKSLWVTKFESIWDVISIIMLYVLPGYFFYNYYITIKNFNNIIYAKTKQQVMQDIYKQFSMHLKTYLNPIQKTINHTWETLQELENHCVYLSFFLLFLVLSQLYYNKNISLYKSGHFFVFIIFLMFNSWVKYKSIYSLDNLKKHGESVVKIAVLNELLSHDKNDLHQKEPEIEMEALYFKQEAHQNRNVFYSKDNNIYKIEKNSKNIILVDEKSVNIDSLIANITNLHYRSPRNAVFLSDNKVKIDINTVSETNLLKIKYIDESFQFKNHQTILQNFQRIIPGISQQELDNYLYLALSSQSSREVYCNENNKNRHRLLVALIFALWDKNDLIVFKRNIFAYYSYEEICDLFTKFQRAPCALCLFVSSINFYEEFKKFFNNSFNIS